jgi:ornithine carbamoyltransferase
MKNEHFLSIADYSEPELMHILDVSIQLKKELKSGGNKPILRGKSMALVFQKASLRTRVSFEMGMQQLGGYAFYLSPDEIGLGKREAVKDIAQVLAGYVDAIMARVFKHEHIVELAKICRNSSDQWTFRLQSSLSGYGRCHDNSGRIRHTQGN